MPATAADIKFFAAVTQTDAADGGGPRGSTVLQNGSTDIFPTVATADRTTGRTRLRKMYAGPVNTDNAAIFGASLAINEVPGDTAVSIAAFAYGDATTRRAAAVTALESGTAYTLTPLITSPGVVSVNKLVLTALFSTGGNVITLPDNVTFPTDAQYTVVPPPVGATVRVESGGVVTLHQVTDRTASGSAGGNTITVAPALPAYVATARVSAPVYSGTAPRLYGHLAVPGALSSGDTAIAVSDTHVRVVPYSGTGPYPTANNGVNPLPFEPLLGRVPAVRAEDVVTVWHEAATTAATYANGNTVDVGRTGLDQMSLVDSAGVEKMRWLAGGPAPGGGFATVNLSTGVLTFVNVTGLAQPCTVRHRIAHRSLVSSVSGFTVNLATALTRAFPSGAVVSAHLPLGDAQARVLTPFGQQAWTNVWSSTLIGSPSPLQYTGAITVTNQGAETDRWALIFSASNAFKCYSERLGLVASGTTASAFAPTNPATGAPYFTLATGGWASGILVGSVCRFDTVGASPPVWVLQTIRPSSPAGTTRTALRLHGTVA